MVWQFFFGYFREKVIYVLFINTKQKTSKMKKKPETTATELNLSGYIFSGELDDGHQSENGECGFFTLSAKMSILEVFEMYETIRDDYATKTNFGMRPSEWAAYGEFENDDYLFIINSPLAKNGDNQWYAYFPQEKGAKRTVNVDITVFRK